MQKGASPIRIFAIADTHLSFGVDKPMSVFGEQWNGYEQRMAMMWRDMITPDDVVLIAGDISWAMREQEVIPDMAYLASLPGQKVLLKGNHDYWWSTKKKVKQLAGDNTYVLQADAVLLPQCTIVGTRGWELPATTKETTFDDEKIYHREIERLRLSLEAGVKQKKPMIAMMHYPPLATREDATPFTDLLEQYQVQHCVYGHLHGHAHRFRVEGDVRGVQYHLVAADFLDFRPIELTVVH